MNADDLKGRFAEVVRERLPLPGAGATAERHRRLMAVGREDLSLAKLAEAHWDAVAILAEAGREPAAGALYAVWASEAPGRGLEFADGAVSGSKMFCSGAGLVDRALVSAMCGAEAVLVEVDLRAAPERVAADGSGWVTEAFRLTQTSTVTFDRVPAGEPLGTGANWYVERPGFWHGACGPAACWAGGAAGLLDAAMGSKRADAHTMAHLGAMYAGVWAMGAMLAEAGREIDGAPGDAVAAQVRAMAVRHGIEAQATEVLRRFARAYGPFPLAMDAGVSRRYLELDLFLRQTHGERDLEGLAGAVRRMDEAG